MRQSSLSLWAGFRTALIICCLVSVAVIVSTAFEIALLFRIAEGRFSWQEVDSNDTRQMIVGILYLVALIATGLLFFRWLYRAVSNSQPMSVGPVAAIVWWFVPLFWLWKGYGILHELSSANSPSGIAHRYLGWYWAMWLIGGWVGLVSAQVIGGDADVDGLVLAGYFTIASHVLLLAAAALLLSVTRRITADQDAKLRAIVDNQPVLRDGDEVRVAASRWRH